MSAIQETTKTKGKPDYGVDAPGIVRSFFLVAFITFLGGLFVPRLKFLASWLRLLKYLLFLVSTVCFGFFSIMTIYAKFGKFRQRDFMLSLIKWRGDESVLDIGTGRGLLSIGAAKRLKTGKVTGIDVWSAKDLSGNSQENTLRNARLEGVLDKIELKTEDARQMDFADNSFDVVFSLYCLNNIEGKDQQATACREAARVLKPGGKLLIGDYIPTHDYAKVLAQAGLTIESSKSYFATALGPMWMVIAHKD